MNFSFLSTLLKKKQTPLQLPDSLLVKKLKEIAQENQLYLFENQVIYHHSKTYTVPLFILDPNRGIYLFEYKEWSYDDLKNATIEKATRQESSERSLAFEITHEFIKQKFNELTHTDGVSLFNFLLTENLQEEEYEHLDDPFKELMPKERLMFNDTPKEEIISKLRSVQAPNPSLPSVAKVIGTLLVQYLIHEENKDAALCTQEQRDFIDADITTEQVLFAPSGSGKTSTIVLKAIVEKLKHPQKKVLIIEPTVLACDIIRQKLLHFIEHTIVELDLTSIEVLTPIELLNKHLFKLKKIPLDETLYIDTALTKNKFDIADIIFCDDAHFYEEDFLDYLRHIQQKKQLLFATQEEFRKIDYSYSRNTFTQHKKYFQEGNPLALSMHLINKLLKTTQANNILLVASSLNKQKLHDDLEYFIENKAILLDSSKHFIDQDLNGVLLCDYQEIYSLRAEYVLLLDLCDEEQSYIDYALSMADKELHIFYETSCPQIKELEDEYRQEKDRSGV